MFPAIWHECSHATSQTLHDIILSNPDHVVGPLWPHTGNEAEHSLACCVVRAGLGVGVHWGGPLLLLQSNEARSGKAVGFVALLEICWGEIINR